MGHTKALKQCIDTCIQCTCTCTHECISLGGGGVYHSSMYTCTGSIITTGSVNFNLLWKENTMNSHWLMKCMILWFLFDMARHLFGKIGQNPAIVHCSAFIHLITVHMSAWCLIAISQYRHTVLGNYIMIMKWKWKS